MRARAVPVALDRLRVQGRGDVEVLGGAVEQPAGDPEVVGDLQRRDRADLELPLARHDLGVDAGDGEARRQAVVQVLLDDVAAEDLVGAHTAVVTALRGGEAALGEAERTVPVEERVLLLDAEDGLLARELLGDRAQRGAGVGLVRSHVDVEDLAQDEDVVTAADRVRTREDRLEDPVGGVALGLVGARTVEAPDGQIRHTLRGAARHDLRLGAKLGGRLGAVDPDVLSLERHGRHPLRVLRSMVRSFARRDFPTVARM